MDFLRDLRTHVDDKFEDLKQDIDVLATADAVKPNVEHGAVPGNLKDELVDEKGGKKSKLKASGPNGPYKKRMTSYVPEYDVLFHRRNLEHAVANDVFVEFINEMNGGADLTEDALLRFVRVLSTPPKKMRPMFGKEDIRGSVQGFFSRVVRNILKFAAENRFDLSHATVGMTRKVTLPEVQPNGTTAPKEFVCKPCVALKSALALVKETADAKND